MALLTFSLFLIHLILLVGCTSDVYRRFGNELSPLGVFEAARLAEEMRQGSFVADEKLCENAGFFCHPYGRHGRDPRVEDVKARSLETKTNALGGNAHFGDFKVSPLGGNAHFGDAALGGNAHFGDFKDGLGGNAHFGDFKDGLGGNAHFGDFKDHNLGGNAHFGDFKAGLGGNAHFGDFRDGLGGNAHFGDFKDHDLGGNAHFGDFKGGLGGNAHFGDFKDHGLGGNAHFGDFKSELGGNAHFGDFKDHGLGGNAHFGDFKSKRQFGDLGGNAHFGDSKGGLGGNAHFGDHGIVANAHFGESKTRKEETLGCKKNMPLYLIQVFTESEHENCGGRKSLVTHKDWPTIKALIKKCDPGMLHHFFTLEELHQKNGTKSILGNIRDTYPPRTFLPDVMAKYTDFGKRSLESYLKEFNVPSDSPLAEKMAFTLELCKDTSDKIKCFSSLEGIADFVTATFGPLEVSMVTGSREFASQVGKTIRIGEARTITKGETLMVVCHTTMFPYQVYFCHKVSATTAALVKVTTSEGTDLMVNALCHKMGMSYVCHWFVETVVMFVPTKYVTHA